MKLLVHTMIVAMLLACPLIAQSPDSLRDSVPAAPDSARVANSPNLLTDSITGQAGILYQNGKPLFPLSPERQQLLHKYSEFTNIWRFVDFFAGLVILALFLFTGVSAKLAAIAHRAKHRYLVVWFYTTLFLVLMYVVNFPLSYYRDYLMELQFGFMNQTFLQWFGETMLSLLIAILLMPLPVFFFYWVVERFRRWWLVFSLGALPFMVFFIVVAPVVISPLFNKYEPLKGKQLEQRILELASKAGIEGSDVFEVNASKQSSKVNAYVTGLFGTKRIVLYDTLIKGFTYEEIGFVMGHEMGHYVMRHIWWGLGVAMVFLIAAFWVTNKTIHRTIHRYRHLFGFDRLSDIASLPLVAAFLTIISFVGQPVSNGTSRYMEHQADVYGLKITPVSADDAARTFEKLAAYNLSDPEPNALIEFWFYNHPALSKRIAFVREYRKAS